MTGAVEGPRNLREGEFEHLTELLTLCFGRLEVAEWPHVCRREPEHFDRYQVCAAGGRIVCSVARVPMALYIEGTCLDVAGISIVATHPEYRRRGLASSCIRATLSEAKRRGFAMAWLNGNRQLYRRFGFERAGRKYNVRFDRRSVASLPASSGGIDDVAAYRDEPSLVSEISRLYDRRKLRGVRGFDLTRMLLSRAGTETTVATRNGAVAGYLTVFRRPDTPRYAEAYEFGGDAESFAALMRHRFRSPDLEEIAMAVPILPDDAHPAVFAGASGWNVGHSGWTASGGMVKLVDLNATLAAFAGQMTRKRREMHSTGGGSLTIELAGTGESATVEADDPIRVTRRRCANTVTFDERDLVHELFGLDRSRHPGLAASVLGPVTPLDFYISPLEMV